MLPLSVVTEEWVWQRRDGGQGVGEAVVTLNNSLGPRSGGDVEEAVPDNGSYQPPPLQSCLLLSAVNLG